jgi:transcriptional regulator with GAF, ATPase, and Fis domain
MNYAACRFPPLRVIREECQRARVATPGRRILDEAVSECRAKEATFWLLSEDGKQMDGTLNRGLAPHILEQISVPVAESVVGMVASNGLAVSIGPDDFHNDAVDKLTNTRTQAMIVAPVHVGGKLLGVMSAVNPVNGGLFSPRDLEALSWKAYLMGLVLDDAFNG